MDHDSISSGHTKIKDLTLYPFFFCALSIRFDISLFLLRALNSV
jgi:hypothetical protein